MHQVKTIILYLDLQSQTTSERGQRPAPVQCRWQMTLSTNAHNATDKNCGVHVHETESAQQDDWCQRGTLFQSLREENFLGDMIDTRPNNVPSRESRPVCFPPSRDMICPAIVTVVPITPSIPPAKRGISFSGHPGQPKYTGTALWLPHRRESNGNVTGQKGLMQHKNPSHS
jgi:hypothetical protein